MKSKLLQCLPSIRWVPSDIPSEGHAHQSQHRSLLSSFNLKQSPSSSKTKKENNGRPIHRRKSNISLTSTPDSELDARTHAQGQSDFFGKLPFEIRLMVYEELFVGTGGEVVHLTMGQKGRFGNFVCQEGEREGTGTRTDGMECGCKVLVGGKDCRRIGGWRVDVLRSCRRMYSEAIRYLYIPHTFSLLHITHLLYLPSRLPSPRLDQIRTLRLRWAIRALPYLRRGNSKKYAYPEDTENWARAWDTVASMKGLRDLYVVLSDPSPANTWEAGWGENQGYLMANVKKVVQTRWFVLVMPYESWSGADVDAKWEQFQEYCEKSVCYHPPKNLEELRKEYGTLANEIVRCEAEATTRIVDETIQELIGPAMANLAEVQEELKDLLAKSVSGKS